MQNWLRVSERRTQIYLPEDIYHAVKTEAKKQGVSMAQIIRKSIENNFPNLKRKRKTDKDREKAWKELMSVAGIIKGEPEDFSANISKYIAQMYKKKKP